MIPDCGQQCWQATFLLLAGCLCSLPRGNASSVYFPVNGMPSLPSSGKPVTLTITTPKRRLLASAAQCDSDAARRPVMNSPLPEGSMRANDPSNELSGSDVAASTMTTPIVVAASDAIKAQLSSVQIEIVDFYLFIVTLLSFFFLQSAVQLFCSVPIRTC